MVFRDERTGMMDRCDPQGFHQAYTLSPRVSLEDVEAHQSASSASRPGAAVQEAGGGLPDAGNLVLDELDGFHLRVDGDAGAR